MPVIQYYEQLGKVRTVRFCSKARSVARSLRLRPDPWYPWAIQLSCLNTVQAVYDQVSQVVAETLKL